jgi:hypothetical protein
MFALQPQNESVLCAYFLAVSHSRSTIAPVLALLTHLLPACRISGIFEDRSISESLTRTKYAYDPNTGRMLTYTLNVGATSNAGALNWSSNGTLNQLQITDTINSANTQTCNHSYDDLLRLSGTNCGSLWSQGFTYDAFGNITKSGSITWNPTYDTANNNRYKTPQTGITYDAKGELTSDTFHTYLMTLMAGLWRWMQYPSLTMPWGARWT